MIHVCSKKQLFNSLVTKEEGTVKMVDSLASKVIDTGTIKITERDETVRVLEAVQYVSEARYNLISIELLDEEGCQIQVQHSVVTVSQRDRVVLEEEKCESLYKLNKENSVRGGVSEDNFGRELIARWNFKEDCDET